MPFEFYRIVFEWGVLPILLAVYLCGKVPGFVGNLKSVFVQPIIDKLDKQETEKQRIYNQLPELGKVRVRIHNAQWDKGFGLVIAIIASVIVGFINPTFWLATVYFIGRWSVRNWRDSNARIRQAEEARRQILSPEIPVGRQEPVSNSRAPGSFWHRV